MDPVVMDSNVWSSPSPGLHPFGTAEPQSAPLSTAGHSAGIQSPPAPRAMSRGEPSTDPLTSTPPDNTTTVATARSPIAIIAAAAAQRKGEQPPSVVPVGPLPALGTTSSELLSHLKPLFLDPNTEGGFCKTTALAQIGGFGIHKGGGGARRMANNVRGQQLQIRCACHGTATPSGIGTSCPWELCYELSTSGWVLWSWKWHHNHPLKVTVAEVMAEKSGRKLPPEEMLKIGEIMAAAGITIAVIRDTLSKWAQRTSVPETWDYQDLHSFFPPSGNAKLFDATNLMKLLQQREEEKDLKWAIDYEGPDHSLTKVFFQCDGGIEEWAVCPESNVVMFDPTWGTNCYKMKCCAFVTISGSGRTVMLAVALLMHEDIESFEWSIRRFDTVFRTSPLLFYTDGCIAIAGAFAVVKSAGDIWEATDHNLCVFHISQTWYRHIRPCCGGNSAGWRSVFNDFWKIAKQTDVRSIVIFDTEWDQLKLKVQHIFEGENNELTKKQENALKWMDDGLYQTRRQWAYRFCWQKLSCGANSSQRVESTQSRLRRSIPSNSLLVALVENVDDMNSRAGVASANADVVAVLKHFKRAGESLPQISVFRKVLSAYAYAILQAQFGEALQYSVRTLESDIPLSQRHMSPPEYSLQRIKSTDDVTVPYKDFEFGEGDRVHNFGLSADMGLAELGSTPDGNRITSRVKCSCQFKEHWGLICRHMWRVLIYEQGDAEEVFLPLIAKVWLKKSPTERSDALVVLRTKSTSRLEDSSRAARPLQSQGQRFTRLVSFFNTHVGEYGSVTMKHVLVTETRLADLGTFLRNLKLVDGDDAVPQPAAVAPDKDSASWESVLGQRWQPARIKPAAPELDTSQQGVALIGRSIAFKWKDIHKGGWALGTITEQLKSGSSDEKTNFKVYYEVDNTHGEHNLQLDSYVNSADADSYSWVLLDSKRMDMSQVPSVSVAPPAVFKRHGGSESTKRKAPQGGPGSAKSKKNSSKQPQPSPPPSPPASTSEDGSESSNSSESGIIIETEESDETDVDELSEVQPVDGSDSPNSSGSIGSIGIIIETEESDATDVDELTEDQQVAVVDELAEDQQVAGADHATAQLAASNGSSESELNWNLTGIEPPSSEEPEPDYIDFGASDDEQTVLGSDDGLAEFENDLARREQIQLLHKGNVITAEVSNLLMLRHSLKRGERQLAQQIASSRVHMSLPSFEVQVHVDCLHFLQNTDDVRHTFDFNVLRPVQELLDECVQSLESFHGLHHNPRAVIRLTLDCFSAHNLLKHEDTLYSIDAYLYRFQLRAVAVFPPFAGWASAVANAQARSNFLNLHLTNEREWWRSLR